MNEHHPENDHQPSSHSVKRKFKLPQDKKTLILVSVIIVLAIALVAVLFSKDDDDRSKSKSGTSEESATVDEGVVSEEGGEKAVENTSAPARPATTKTSSATSTPKVASGSCKPGLSGKKNEALRAIVLSWTVCKSEDFQYYKLVKSSTNSSPGYPGDPVAFSTANKSVNSYIDKTVTSSTTYNYRVCALERLGKVTCGNAVSVGY